MGGVLSSPPTTHFGLLMYNRNYYRPCTGSPTHPVNCKCSRCCMTSFVSARSTNPVTDEMYKTFLFNSLTVGDNCIPDNFQDMLDTLWELMQFQSGCDNELQFLLTRLELLKILMGCKVRDVDRLDSITESNSETSITTRQDGLTQSQQTGHSSGYRDMIGEQRYKDFAEGTTRAQSRRTAYTESHDESHQIMDDTGHGESDSQTDGFREGKSNRYSRDYSESESTNERDGARRGQTYEYSASTTGGNGTNLAAVGFGRTATKNTWDMYQRADTADSGFSSRSGHSLRKLRGVADSRSTSQRISSSFFNALMDDKVWGESIAKAEDHQSAQSDVKSHAEGKGQSASESEAKSQGSTQATSQSETTNTIKRDGSRSSYTISDSISASQRMKALLDLFDLTKILIKNKRERLAANQGYAISRMMLCDPCGFIPSWHGSPMKWRLCGHPQEICCDCDNKKETSLLNETCPRIYTTDGKTYNLS